MSGAGSAAQRRGGRRAAGSKPSSSSGKGSGAAANNLNAPGNNPALVYSVDGSGLKFEPMFVLVGALVFIGAVVVLHIVGKVSSFASSA